MKVKRFERFISAVLSVMVLAASVSIVPVSTAAAETDVQVTHFRQMRCNNTKTRECTYTGETYYASGFLIDILSGERIDQYSSVPGESTTKTGDRAEIKTEAREYGLMRVKLNAEDIEGVNIQFAVNGTGKIFAAYDYNCEFADWTEENLTDNNHVPTTYSAVDITYAASLATGYDWSQKGIDFQAVDPLDSDTSESDRFIDLSVPVTEEDNARGYKDILIKNNTSLTDATNIIVGEPVVSAYKKSFPASVSITGRQSATVYMVTLPSVIDKYTAAVNDENGNKINVPVEYSIDDTVNFEIAEDGTLTAKAGMEAGEYRVNITAAVDEAECKDGVAVTSAPFEVVVTVSDETPALELEPAQLLWLRANGKSNGVTDGSCGNNWYYAGDSGLKELNEIESGTGFGLITGFDLKSIASGQNDIYDVKLCITSAGATEDLAIWVYDGDKPHYYGDNTDKMAVTTAIKTMLPSWNTDWQYDVDGEDAEPLAEASPENGIYTFDLDYEQLKDFEDENGIINFFVTSVDLSSRRSATKVYLSGSNAPYVTYKYREKPQANGIIITGEDRLVFAGTVPETENTYEAKFTTQYDDITSDITDGRLTWSIEGSEYVSYDSQLNSIIISGDLPEGTTPVTLKVRYKKKDIVYEAEKEIEIEKRDISIPTSVTISGESSMALVRTELPAEFQYTAEVINQNGDVMRSEECDWSVSGTDIDGISINENGVLIIGKDASSAVITIKAASKSDPAVYAEYSVTAEIAEYPSVIYPNADVLFRKGNTDTKNVNGAELEITNSVDNDRAFVGGLKFDISTLRQAIANGQPVVSVKLRLTSTLSKDGKLMLKPLSNDWNESDAVTNSYESKSDIITEAVSSAANVIDNEENKTFTLNRMTKDKYIYDLERGDTETIANWQTELDITDYLLGTGTDNDINKNGYIADNKDTDFVSFLLMANYNGTNANKIFTKDVSKTTYSDHWQELIDKFPEIAEDTAELKPAIIIDYAKDGVSITSEISKLPIPLTDEDNSIQLTAEHYDPFTEKTDKEIDWSIVKYSSEKGEFNGAPTGVSIDKDGVLSVSKTASGGTVTVRAASKVNNVAYTDIEISVLRLASQLANGSFEDVTDAVMPKNWSSYDEDIDAEYNGVRRYKMDQVSESQLSNIMRASDDDGLVSGTYTTDPDGNKALMFKGAQGITKDYEGYAYAHNAQNNNADGGPDIRVTSGITYWVSQDYKMKELYQLNDSAVVGPYISYEGFQGTTSKKSQFNGTWYFKDGNQTTPYTTEGYDTITNQITVPANINRLRINWGFKASEGEIYLRNFRIAPQGIDTSKPAADGVNELKVTDKMVWTSDPIAVAAGSEYTYKLSVMTDNVSSGNMSIVFKNSEGKDLSEEKITQSKTLDWKMITGTVVPPKNTAYAEIRLANGAKSGNVWYDDIIFTRSGSNVPTYIKITSDNTMITIPENGQNRFMFNAVVTDQYNNPCNADVKWSVNYGGVSVLDNGALIVSSDAQNGNIVIKAETDGKDEKISAEITVPMIKEVNNSENVTLLNSSFAEKDEDNLPKDWTNAGRELSIANTSFDTSVSGWRLNYTTYSSSDTSALIEWDQSVDHSGNSGGSARIYNADRAQGSMQISDNISIKGGQTYDFSVWVKTEHISTDSNVYVNLLLYDKNGSAIEETKQLLVFYPTDTDGIGNNTSDWTKLSGSMYINENAVKLRIDMRYRGGANNNNGTVWFDDLSVTKQTGIDSSKMFGENQSLMLSGYNFEEDDASRNYGEKWNSAPLQNIKAGQDYYYSANIQTLNATDGAYIMITYYNADGREIGNVKSDKFDSSENKWTLVKGAATAPAGAASAVMSLCIDGKGIAWFADAKFETKAPLEVTAVSIGGNDTVALSSKNYYYTVITDQYGLTSDKKHITVTAEKVPAGMEYDSNTGILTVASDAQEGTEIKLSASYNGLIAAKNVRLLAKTTAISIKGAETVRVPLSSSKEVEYKVYNQQNQQIAPSDVKWYVSSNEVSVSDGIVSIPAKLSGKTITVTAEYEGFRASIVVTLTAAATQGSGGTGGGGGGGGSGLSGIDKTSVKATPAPKAMGNFTVPDNSDDTVLPNNGGNGIENLLPQPDPTYFTQGMDNVAGFSDIGNVQWAHKAIAALHNVKVINGKTETEFYPNDNITRAEFTQILIGTLKYAKRIEDTEAVCSFDDVADDAWYYNSVALAVKYGIVSGMSEKEFAPDALISRQDMCVMIARACSAAEIELPKGASLVFNDNDNIASYALDAVTDMSRAGVVSGFEDGTFRPADNATRAQAAVIIYRMAGGE